MSEASDRPNIVVLMTDQHRRDCLGAYGATVVRTPNLDRLAEGAVIFDRYYSSCPLCAPARCSIATGRYAHEHGVLLNGSRLPERKYALLHEGEKLIYDVLFGEGYYVGHIGVDHIHAQPRLSERESVHVYASRGQYREYLAERGLEEPDLSAFRQACREVMYGREIVREYSSPRVGRHPIAEEHFYDMWIARQAAQFVREAPRERPFALFCNFWLPHPPVVVPEPYFSMYQPEEVLPPPNFLAPLASKPKMHLRHLPGQLGASQGREQWLATIAVYYGMVTFADRCVGVVLDALEERGALESSVIMFFPDHGEMLGCHSLHQKMVCYEEAIHLPCLVRAPGAVAGRRGQLASHVDIMPTLLDYAGAAVPEGISGVSLRQVIENPNAAGREAVFCEYNGNFGPGYFQRAVITERYKYIENSGDISELYDLQEDPFELHNLIQDEPTAEERELSALLGQWQRETGDFLGFEQR